MYKIYCDYCRRRHKRSLVFVRAIILFKIIHRYLGRLDVHCNDVNIVCSYTAVRTYIGIDVATVGLRSEWSQETLTDGHRPQPGQTIRTFGSTLLQWFIQYYIYTYIDIKWYNTHIIRTFITYRGRAMFDLSLFFSGINVSVFPNCGQSDKNHVSCGRNLKR